MGIPPQHIYKQVNYVQNSLSSYIPRCSNVNIFQHMIVYDKGGARGGVGAAAPPGPPKQNPKKKLF